MKLTKCENGHFYDADKYPGCPYCDSELRKGGSTIAAEGGGAAEAARSAGPVVGWLVGLEGPGLGQDLRLAAGRNALGLDAAGAAQTLSADAPLSARLLEVVYDPAKAAFTLLPGTGRELGYRNGAAVLAEQPLEAGDVLTVGEAQLVFVPFCGPDFQWPQKPAKPAPKAPAPKAVKPKKSKKAKAEPKPAEDKKEPAEKAEEKPAEGAGEKAPAEGETKEPAPAPADETPAAETPAE